MIMACKYYGNCENQNAFCKIDNILKKCELEHEFNNYRENQVSKAKSIEISLLRTGSKIKDLRDENNRLKELLGIAITDFERVTKMCGGFQCDSCPHEYSHFYCEWQYKDEAMKLIGGDENAKIHRC